MARRARKLVIVFVISLILFTTILQILALINASTTVEEKLPPPPTARAGGLVAAVGIPITAVLVGLSATSIQQKPRLNPQKPREPGTIGMRALSSVEGHVANIPRDRVPEVEPTSVMSLEQLRQLEEPNWGFSPEGADAAETLHLGYNGEHYNPIEIKGDQATFLEVKGDGSCGYRSLSYLLRGHQRMYSQLRENLGRYILKQGMGAFNNFGIIDDPRVNPDRFTELYPDQELPSISPEELGNYLVANPTECDWINHHMIIALSKMLKRPIKVYRQNFKARQKAA
tara:strand:+ start:26438 stop:27292 length:855 start_codon:yes stop_codon:yes gene_type:complete